MEKILRKMLIQRGYIPAKDSTEYRDVIYIFTQEVKDKFHKIMENHPDFGDIKTPALFAYIPRASIEKGLRRAMNNGEYMLFSMVDGVPKIIKNGDGKWRRKNTKRGGYWDIHKEGILGIPKKI